MNMYEEARLLSSIGAGVGSYITDGIPYDAEGNVLVVSEDIQAKVKKKRQDVKVEEIEALYAIKVDEFVKHASSLDGATPRRLSDKGMKAQVTVYNTFQSATALGLAEDLSDGAKQAIQGSLPVFATLSTMMDTITTKIYSDEDYSQELQELKDYTYVVQRKGK